MADWSDWHVVGGGRWNPEGDSYKDTVNMVVSYKDNPDKFKEVLSDIKKYRIKYMKWITHAPLVELTAGKYL